MSVLSRSKPALAACLLAALGVSAGCSSSDSQTSADAGTSTSSSPSTSDDSTSSSASPSTGDSTGDSTGATYDVRFRSTDGWTYASTLPLPTATLSADKDISSAPPGYASISLSLSSTPDSVDPQQLADTNPGRPGGPDLPLPAGTFVFPISGRLIDQIDNSMLTKSGNAAIGNPQIGPCTLYPPYGGGQFWWPSESGALFCTPATGSGEAQYPASERLVDQLATAVSSVKPIYVVNYETNGLSACNVAIYPSGRVQFAPDYAESCPSKLSIVAHID